MIDRCIHCDPQSFALSERLHETENFWIACDIHPLVEGHILIVPKKHISCAGAFGPQFFTEFQELYRTFSDFLKRSYGTVGTFEHGILGQTVFHAHVHLLPFVGKPTEIVPEGNEKIISFPDLAELQKRFETNGKYLFFSINDAKYFVNESLGVPRFFRDRFARALGAPQRGSWIDMENDSHLMSKSHLEIQTLMQRWRTFSK